MQTLELVAQAAIFTYYHVTCWPRSSPYLEVDHVPEPLEVSTGGLLFSRLELTGVDEAGELLEALVHQQLGHTHGRPNLALHCHTDKYR